MINENQEQKIEDIRQKVAQPKIPVTLNLNEKDYKKIQEYLEKANDQDPKGNKIKFSDLINFYMKDILKNDKKKEGSNKE